MVWALGLCKEITMAVGFSMANIQRHQGRPCQETLGRFPWGPWRLLAASSGGGLAWPSGGALGHTDVLDGEDSCVHLSGEEALTWAGGSSSRRALGLVWVGPVTSTPRGWARGACGLSGDPEVTRRVACAQAEAVLPVTSGGQS